MEKARIVENDKGFKVIEIPRDLLLEKLAINGSIGICDMCLKSPLTGYHVAVLNQWLCEDCYKDFIERGVWYKEDEPYELRNFYTFCKLFDVEE